MARTRQEIVSALLEKAATDPILDTVSRSLVGKELLYFGANVIYQLEQAGNVIASFADLARADAQQLIAYAYTHEVPCAFTKPAVVRVKVNTNEVQTFAPYTVYLSVGGTRFYNIDFVSTDREFTLYQGTPKAIVSVAGRYLDAFSLDTLGIIRQYQNWKLYKEFSDGTYISSYLKLGTRVVPESVRVFAKALTGDTEGIVFPYTEFNQGLSNPSAKLYKVRTGWDKSVNLYFGDTNWSEQVNQELYDYEIYFLEASVTNFTVTSSNKLTLGDKTVEQKANADGVSFTVTSYSMGEESSLSYARTSILSAQFLAQGLVTEQQITNYVNSLDVINSSKLLVNKGTHSVHVVIKPSDPNNTEFGYLEDILRQNGAIGVNYSVTVATPLNFRVKLTSIGSTSSINMTRAQQVIAEYCSYDNITLATQISSATLNQVLQASGINDIVATIAVDNEPAENDAFGQQKLQSTPAVNTLKLYNANGQLIGYDSDGIIQRLSTEPVPIGEVTGGSVALRYTYPTKVGDFLFAPSKNGEPFFLDRQQSRILAASALTLTDVSGNPVMQGSFFDYNDSDTVLFMQRVTGGASKLLLYSLGNSIYKGDTSIFNRRTQLRAVAEYGCPSPVTHSGVTGWCPLICMNGVYYLPFGGGMARLAIVNGELKSIGSRPNETGVFLSYSEYDERYVFVYNSVIWAAKLQKDNTTVLASKIAPNYSVTSYTVLGIQSPADMRWCGVHDGYFYTINQSGNINDPLIVSKYEIREIPGSMQLQVQFLQKLEFKARNVRKPEDTTYNVRAEFIGDNVLVLDQYGCYMGTMRGANYGYIEYAKAEQFLAEGSIDYNTGTVYGVNVPNGAYYKYDVAGTLTGDTIYPRYVLD